jgi:hypothetical protein
LLFAIGQKYPLSFKKIATTTKMHGDFTYLFNVLVGLVSFIGLGVSFIGGFVGLGLVSLTVNSGA